MPKFLDYHAQMPQLPPEMAQAMAAQIKAGQADQFGVKPLNVFVGTRGEGHCLTEAPSADAVAQSHAAVGIAIGASDIAEVMTLA